MFRDWFYKKADHKYLWPGLALLALTLLYVVRAPLNLRNTYLIDAAGKQEAISLPFLRDIPVGAEYVISGTVYYQRWLNCQVMRLIPDDQVLAIRVNRRDVSLAGVDPAALRDYVNGFHYNLGGYLRNGVNHLEIRIKNTMGPSGLNVTPSYLDWRLEVGYWLAALLLLGLAYLLASGASVRPGVAVIVTGGFIIRFLYFLNTPFASRTHDVGGHMQYIEYLVNQHTLPALHYGWQTYQPPLYYQLAASVYKLLHWTGINDTNQIWRGLQLLSLFLAMGFLMVTWQIIKRTVAKLPVWEERDGSLHPEAVAVWERRRLRLAYLIFAVITFWPSGILHAVRIGNDALFYFLYILGLWFLIKWQDDDTRGSLYRSFIWITLAFITKANALVLYLVFGIVYLIKFSAAANKRKYLQTTVILLAIFMIGFGITFGRMVEAKLKGSKDHFVVANTSGLLGVAVGNSLRNYCYFDVPTFVTEPYVNPWDDKGGRQYFWNYFLKTGLVGEFWYNNDLHRNLTRLFSWLLLLMLGYTVFGLIIWRRYLREQLILILNALCLIIAAIAFRISIPASCSNDFRYVFPLLVSFGCCFGFGLWFYRQQKWRWLEMLGYGLAILLITTSVVFFGAMMFYKV